MGSKDKKRLFVAALGIAAIALVLDRTIFTDGGMTAQLINQARYASKALEGKIPGQTQ